MTFREQFKIWQHTLNRYIVKSFPKIRTRIRKFSETECGKLFEVRKRLKLELQESDNPKHKPRNSIAVRDSKGNLITSPEGITKFCLDEVLTRLHHRKMHPDLLELQKLKELLCKKRLELARHKKSKHFTMKEMEKALSTLKPGRCRDAQGYTNEIFRYGGEDLKLSLLKMVNHTKHTLEIPDSMNIVNIAMIPKPGKHASTLISNQCGIFIISKLRSILMTILLKYEYEMIDNYMSDSNVGGRRGRRIQDHLFIINGINFEHAMSKKNNPITIGIYDYRQCFDSMWQEEVVNDLFEAGIQEVKLVLLFEITKNNKVAVNTPDGLSERKNVEKIICQGDQWGSLECALQVDTIGKDSLKAELEPYKYKNKVEIPALGVVDDLLTVCESGYKAARMNSLINAKTAIKKLQFGPQKCHVLHV